MTSQLKIPLMSSEVETNWGAAPPLDFARDERGGGVLVILWCSVLALAGCSTEPDRPDQSRIACAIGTSEFANDCTVEQATHPEGAILTIRHPDGGFRRLVTTSDGRGVAPADGAEEANVKLIGEGQIEVQIGNARYRLPATVKGAN